MKLQCYFFYFKMTSFNSPTLEQQYKVMIGAFVVEIKITLVFYIYHGFLMQQFRISLHCFNLFIVAHYEKIYSWLQIFEEGNSLK